ncbi:oocyte zinc finger protein XlCOF8.4-like [Syngnathus typhle]|uniref:oocyte zinc finger protein XlCOF8.4-like n=1 Tax=Syngnathus typhle TaxID=161592 RepID=UPI002A6B2298|nr:oocyte zinc finger protein XlCOF8.4-like [Syngnathus typhle]
MSATTTAAKYVKEKDRCRRRLEHLWLQPYVVLRRADISEAFRPKQEEPDRTRIKEEDVGKEVHHFNEQMEQKFLCTKKEEEEPERPCQKEDGEDSCDIKKEEEDTCEMPLTGVLVKCLDEAQREVSKGAEPPSCSSSPHMTREGDGDHCGASRAAPPSDSDDGLSHVPADDDDDDSQNKHRQCSHCGICFAHTSSLKQHMRMHTRKKNFSCSDCGKKFSQRGHLNRHTRTHTGEKPFSCSVCGQTFSQREGLNVHTRIHTGEKPFSCSVCGQMFSQRVHLNMHTLTHTGEKPFSCSVCGQMFSQRGTFKYAHKNPHWRETFFMLSLWPNVLSAGRFKCAHKNPHCGVEHYSRIGHPGTQVGEEEGTPYFQLHEIRLPPKANFDSGIILR